MDDETLGKLLAEVHREYADYRRPEGVCVSPSSMSVMVDRTGKPVEENTGIAEEQESSSAQIRTLCSMNRDERSSQNVARKFLITNSKQLEQNKNATFYKKNYGVSNRIFVQFINKILLRWRNYDNFRVLPSIRSQDGSSSRTRTLLWNYLEDYKNCKMK